MQSEIPTFSMKLSKKDQQGNEICCETPDYPYGLTLHLSNEILEKLKMKTLPEVGKMCVISGAGKVVSVSENDSKEGGKRRDVTIQIEELGVVPAEKKKSASTILYGGK